MTELIVDIGDITIPDGFRKDRAVYQPAESGERYVSDIVREATCNHVMKSIVLIPEPKPYVWPEWCPLWGAAMDENGKVWLYTHQPELEGAVWQIQEGVYLSPETVEAVGMPLITKDHFTAWTKPILNPHWRGE